MTLRELSAILGEYCFIKAIFITVFPKPLSKSTPGGTNGHLLVFITLSLILEIWKAGKENTALRPTQWNSARQVPRAFISTSRHECGLQQRTRKPTKTIRR